MFLDSHFSNKQEKFDNLNTFGDSDLEEDETEEQKVKVHNEDESGMFYSWECISFVKKNGTTLDLVIPSAPDLLSLIHVVHKHEVV